MTFEFGKLYTIAEVAEGLGVAKSTVTKYIHSGELVGAKLGRGWVISERDLREFMKRKFGIQDERAEAEADVSDG